MTSVLTCEHLGALEADLRERGLRFGDDTRNPWRPESTGRWLYVQAVLDPASVRTHFALPDFVTFHDYDGKLAGAEAGFVCTRDDCAVMGLHPAYAADAPILRYALDEANLPPPTIATPPAPMPASLPPERRRKRVWLLTLVANALVSGACAAYFALHRQHNWIEAPLGVLFLLSIFGWYHADSTARGFHRGPFSNFLVVALAAIGIPVYLFRTRGFTRGLFGTAMALLILAGCLVAALLGAMTVMLSSGAAELLR